MNSSLARTYRSLQGRFVDVKSKVMDMFDERNRLEASIKDLKQLKGQLARFISRGDNPIFGSKICAMQ